MNTTPSLAREAVELPEPHVLDGHYRDHTDKVNGYSEAQVRALLAAKREELYRMREALQDMLGGVGECRTSLGQRVIDSPVGVKARKVLYPDAALSPIQGEAG